MRVDLVPFPSSPPIAAAVTVSLDLRGRDLALTYVVTGAPRLRLSPPGSAERLDGLWRATCFEAFLMGEGPAYAEYNFAPSSAWAAYRFTDRRAGMAAPAIERPPQVRAEPAADGVTVSVLCDLSVLSAPTRRIGLTAVLEDDDGTLAYWALAHPGPAPDFHDPAGFRLLLSSLETP